MWNNLVVHKVSKVLADQCQVVKCSIHIDETIQEARIEIFIMRKLVIMRIVGSVLVITGYFTLLHVNVVTGVLIHLLADILSIPFFVKTKAFDVVAVLSFLSLISISKLLSL